MNVSSIFKSSQEQGVASWIDYLNQLRLNELMANLTKQDTNLADALNMLNEFKLDIDALINSNRGGEKGLHGFIAERAQVSIANARKIIEGLKADYVLVNDNGPVDLLKEGIPIQQKFVQANLSLNAIKEHLEKYPDFIKNGGKYQIPNDFYAALEKYATMSAEQGNKLTGAERSVYVAVQKFLKESGIDLKDIEPAVVDYSDVQKGKINETIDKEKDNIEEADKKQREKYHEESKPTLKEGLKATAVSAAVEGGMGFCLAVAEKLKAGKKLNEFTEQDWKDVGVDTAKSTEKGAIRGATIYTLTNFSATPAAVASALVTATFGLVAQAQLLRQGEITSEEFIQNSEVVCLDVTVSAIASIMGGVLIPVPGLGAVIGNAVGMFMYGIAKEHLAQQEQTLIFGFNESIQVLNEQLDSQYKALIELLKQEFEKFKSVVALAFDLNVNVAFAGSITLAQYVGCSEAKILKDKAAIDDFFLSNSQTEYKGERKMNDSNNEFHYEDDFMSDMQKFEYTQMLEKADNVVLGFVAATGATGAIPIPFADAPLLIGEQVAMMVAINDIFKIDVSKDALKSLVSAAIGVGGATMVGKTVVANALKFIPGVGSVAGGAISAATAGMITLALGKAYIQVCKAIKMGKLNQDDLAKKAGVEALKASFMEQIKSNKK